MVIPRDIWHKLVSRVLELLNTKFDLRNSAERHAASEMFVQYLDELQTIYLETREIQEKMEDTLLFPELKLQLREELGVLQQHCPHVGPDEYPTTCPFCGQYVW